MAEPAAVGGFRMDAAYHKGGDRAGGTAPHSPQPPLHHNHHNNIDLDDPIKLQQQRHQQQTAAAACRARLRGQQRRPGRCQLATCWAEASADVRRRRAATAEAAADAAAATAGRRQQAAAGAHPCHAVALSVSAAHSNTRPPRRCSCSRADSCRVWTGYSRQSRVCSSCGSSSGRRRRGRRWSCCRPRSKPAAASPCCPTHRCTCRAISRRRGRLDSLCSSRRFLLQAQPGAASPLVLGAGLPLFFRGVTEPYHPPYSAGATPLMSPSPSMSFPFPTSALSSALASPSSSSANASGAAPLSLLTLEQLEQRKSQLQGAHHQIPAHGRRRPAAGRRATTQQDASRLPAAGGAVDGG